MLYVNLIFFSIPLIFFCRFFARRVESHEEVVPVKGGCQPRLPGTGGLKRGKERNYLIQAAFNY